MRFHESWPHTAGASRTYELVWSEAATDPIVSETFEVVQGSGITLSTVPPDGTKRRFRADGGTADTFVFVKHSVVFTSGDEDSRIVRLQVLER